jgi:endoglucanase
MAHAADVIFPDGFEVPVFRGTNVVGMEMSYVNNHPATWPVPDTDYPVYDTGVIDYFASKHMTAIRFLFSWEAVQPHLGDSIPFADGGNYQAYFNNYKRIVDYATDVKGMQVIIEPWQADSGGNAGGARWRGDLVGSNAVSINDFADFWSKVATNFKDNGLVSYGLVNEPNNMSTMTWFSAAQAAITAIRATGSRQRIFVPGNGYTAASGWTSNYYDTDPTNPVSNAYGWLHANGGQPIFDPLNNIVAEVHTYLDSSEGGLADDITAITAARDHVSVALNEATAHGYKIYLGEIGIYAGNPNAYAAWADFVSYFNANQGPLMGFTWWAGGMPDWWNDLHAPHFAISPTDNVNFTGDTVNMQMIQNDF